MRKSSLHVIPIGLLLLLCTSCGGNYSPYGRAKLEDNDPYIQCRSACSTQNDECWQPYKDAGHTIENQTPVGPLQNEYSKKCRARFDTCMKPCLDIFFGR